MRRCCPRREDRQTVVHRLKRDGTDAALYDGGRCRTRSLPSLRHRPQDNQTRRRNPRHAGPKGRRRQRQIPHRWVLLALPWNNSQVLGDSIESIVPSRPAHLGVPALRCPAPRPPRRRRHPSGLLHGTGAPIVRGSTAHGAKGRTKRRLLCLSERKPVSPRIRARFGRPTTVRSSGATRRSRSRARSIRHPGKCLHASG